ncbi:longitudinals lacking protein, isoforms N/O/W/X/Y-like [Topomyia yanbarensis]|uniref:longitudinals lacking protein, isoforms N/O/W/X/Y-like n=1 Tax=Topomyia yanbarensis TaxID=2498891 RepID=UPI00273B6144|nr:longitudinals lacking protein, isoforms N/O/W/X/Y-like [Topomyia yanbarensis]
MASIAPSPTEDTLVFEVKSIDADAGTIEYIMQEESTSSEEERKPLLRELASVKKERKIPPHMRPKNDCEARFECPKCGKGYSLAKNMRRHARLECDQEPKFACPHCPLRCKRNNQLKRHITSRHLNKS